MLLHLDPELPASERLGIPVYFHPAVQSRDNGTLPVDVPLDDADRVLVVVLVGDHTVTNIPFRRWLTDLRKTCERQKHVTVLGIALSEKAANNQRRIFGEVAREHAGGLSPVELNRFVRIVVLRTLANMLGPKGKQRFRVFVSHATADGAEVAAALTRRLTALKSSPWLDVQQIEGGQGFRKQLKKGIANSTFVAVVSDRYAASEWCRWEVQLAKERDTPMVVLDMVSEGQRRSLPALGNVPVIRMNTLNATSARADIAYDRVVEALLTELVMSRYFPHTIDTDDVGGDHRVFHAPPDLVTLAAAQDEVAEDALAVYPDPPLPDFEARFLERSTKFGRVRTPLSLLGADAPAGSSDRTLRVAISISDVPEADLVERGLSRLHLRALFLQICRHVLAAGHDLAYGGDLRLMGFVHHLADLERSYSFNDEVDRHRIRNYVARYVHETSDFDAAVVDIVDLVDFKLHRRRRGATEPTEVTAALDLTAMRKKMDRETDLRIIVGGQLESGKVGTRRGPGLLEEAVIALTASDPTPLVVAGGYGGAAALLADALEGRADGSLVDGVEPHFAGLEPLLATTRQPGGLRSMIDKLREVEVPSNGLRAEVNAELRDTTDSDTIVRAVVESLRFIENTSPP